MDRRERKRRERDRRRAAEREAGENALHLVLLAIGAGRPLVPVGGGLTLPLPFKDGGEVVMKDFDRQLDRLEALGWVSVETDPPTVTGRGHRAISAWAARKGLVPPGVVLEPRALAPFLKQGVA